MHPVGYYNTATLSTLSRLLLKFTKYALVCGSITHERCMDETQRGTENEENISE